MSGPDKELTVFEHLAELRKRLLWSLGALLSAAPFAWWQRERFFHWLRVPFDDACRAVFGPRV